MFSTTASVPPFYWKVPAPEKNYMGENVRRVRQSNSQVKKDKIGGLKAAFIPGVTKNPKYEHVPSRFLKGEVHFEPRVDVQLVKSKSQASAFSNYSRPSINKYNTNTVGTTTYYGNGRNSEKLLNTSKDIPKPIWGASASYNARTLSKSTTDLTFKQKSPAPVRSLGRKQQPLLAENESINDWRFSDSNNYCNPAELQQQKQPHHKFPNFPNPSRMHRVEYLPCDGICADEEVFANEEPLGDSGRSASSSARTSRGVNTEETRIFEDTSFKKPFIKPIIKSLSHTNAMNRTRFQENEDYTRKHWSGHDYDGEVNGVEKDFSTLKVKENNSNVNVTKAADNSKSHSHSLGTVPKYLKQRQQEWKEEAEAKKEAERSADIPAGHVLMSDNERVETMKTLKGNYDTLVGELNRIPIRIDTIRVRDQKIRLEEQLTKLEQAMRIFSRPRVFVKMDQ